MSQLTEIGGDRSNTQQKYLVNRIENSLKGQRRIEKHLQDYLYIYRYTKQENAELSNITKETISANKASSLSNVSHTEMLKNLQSDHLDDDVKLKHERAFIRKLKVWHQADMQ